MSSKYCRYCGHCIEIIGGYYCREKERFFTESTVRSHVCGEFGDCGIDVITGKDVEARKPYTKRANDGTQIGMGGISL